jgi:ribonuclease HII
MAVAARSRTRGSALRRLLAHDRSFGSRYVAGADEAGRGALAGPLVVAAVLLEPLSVSVAERRALRRLDDSKRCTHAARVALLPAVFETARRISVVVVPVSEVDATGIHRADLAALARCLREVAPADDVTLLADGFRVPLERDHAAVIDGDTKSAAIAAASIVAKVTRDRLMERLAEVHEGYGFERHVGYGTPEHLAALRRLGPTALHRRSFAPCSQLTLGV